MFTEEEIEEMNNFARQISAFLDGGDWDGIRSRIELFVNYHKSEAFIFWFCTDDRLPPDILQMAFNKRREIREKESKTGRDFPPHKKSFCNQMIHDVCCCDLINANDLSLDSIGLPNLNVLLQEHERMFPPSAALKSDEFQESKRDYISKMIWAESEFFVGFFADFPESQEDLLHSIQSIDDLRGRNDLAYLLQLWERTEIIMLYQKTDSLPLLHYAVKQGYPFIIVWFISKIYPDQIRKRDSHGCIPLHYSFRDYYDLGSNFFKERFYKQIGIGSYSLVENPYYGVDSKYLVPSYLFEDYPEGAALSDRIGKLPLHMFLEKVRDGWRKNDENTERFCKAFMNRLIAAAPKALATRDMVSNLYPFMIPPTKPDERKEEEEESVVVAVDDDEEEERNNRLLLASTYEILRQNPAVLISFIDPDESPEPYSVRSLRTDVENLRQDVKNLQTKLLVAKEIDMKQKDEIIKLREEIERLRLVEASSTTVEKRSDGKNGSIDFGNPKSSSKKRSKLV